VVIPEGDTTATLSFTILGDALDEDSEVFFVHLSNPEGGIIGTPKAMVVITDDDPLPRLSIPDVLTTEGDTGARIHLFLDAISGRDVSLTIATADSTAQAPVDYTAISTPVTILAGQTSTSLALSVAEDAELEVDEIVLVQVSSPVHVALSSDLPALVTIVSPNCAGAGGTTRRWTGLGADNNWETPGNWSGLTVPTALDSVVIPANSGTIFVTGPKTVRALCMAESTTGTFIHGVNSGASIKITATEDIIIGEGNLIWARDGGVGQKGGNVELTSTGGRIVNDGALRGGNGGAGGTGGQPGEKPGKPGGDIIVTAPVDCSSGSETGGDGGSASPGTLNGGGPGGSVVDKAKVKQHFPTKKGGRGGTGTVDGSDGSVSVTGGHIEPSPGARLTGDIVLVNAPEDTLGDLSLIPAGDSAIVATRYIFIDLCDTCDVDLRGHQAGQYVMVAGENICIFGRPILDPGVTLADITSPTAVVSSTPCLGISGTPEPEPRVPSRFALQLSNSNVTRVKDGVSFTYEVPDPGGDVSIAVFDVMGRKIDDVAYGFLKPGLYEGRWETGRLGYLVSGLYFLSLKSGDVRLTSRIFLMK